MIRPSLRALTTGLLIWVSCGVALAAPRTFVVNYRSQTTVYVDGGSADGLAVGQKLKVASGSNVVAELEVVYVAERSASARVLSESRPVRPGDKVVPAGVIDGVRTAMAPASQQTPAAAAPESAPPVANAAAAAPSAPAPPPAQLHGSVALDYSRTVDRTGSGFDFQETTARVDLRASEIGGRPLSFVVRLQGREDVRANALGTGAPARESDNRLYEAGVHYDSRDHRVSFEAGRIGASYFSGIGLLDGVSVAAGVTPSVQLGGFFGRRADLFGLGFEGGGAKFGGFFRLTPVFSPTWRGEALIAYVHEDANGDVNRDYASLEARLHAGTRLAFFQRAEVDWNRGWRAGTSQPTFQLSNISLNAQIRLWNMSSLSVTYDGRRRYRTYLDRALPEDLFDSTMAEGVTSNLMLASRQGLRFSAGGGLRSLTGTSGTACFASAGFAHDGLADRRASVGIDASGYRNGYTEGLLVIGRAARRFGRGHSIELSGGGSFYRLRADQARRATEWGRLALRGELGHGVYALGDGEYDFGDDLSGPRGLFELGWRF